MILSQTCPHLMKCIVGKMAVDIRGYSGGGGHPVGHFPHATINDCRSPINCPVCVEQDTVIEAAV